MFDRYNRSIHYLRISVTDRCNLRCAYCAAGPPVPSVPQAEMLSFEEIREVAAAAAGLGFDKIRLTGGEPLLRRGVESLVALLAGVAGVRDLCMTTNGILLSEFAVKLARAGLRRINVSLDSVDAAEFRTLTGGGELAAVLEGVRAARAAGLWPVKLNCVVERSPEEPRARAVAAFGAAEGLEVRFIRRMDTARGEFAPVHGGSGGDCAACDRLRLTCTGRVLPCLFSDLAFSVRELGAAGALEAAIAAKPECGKTSHHHFRTTGG